MQFLLNLTFYLINLIAFLFIYQKSYVPHSLYFDIIKTRYLSTYLPNFINTPTKFSKNQTFKVRSFSCLRFSTPSTSRIKFLFSINNNVPQFYMHAKYLTKYTLQKCHLKKLFQLCVIYKNQVLKYYLLYKWNEDDITIASNLSAHFS